MAPPPGINIAPPPWTLRGTAYIFPFWVSAAEACAGLPSVAQHPLEAGSSSSGGADGSTAAGRNTTSATDKPIGGLGTVQIIRYTKSPVGPYDEMIVSPGQWEYDVEDPDTRRRSKRRNLRITRIYVSQKDTCWNGRTSKLFFLSINCQSSYHRGQQHDWFYTRHG